MTWTGKLRKQYKSLEEFKHWCEIYNNHGRLGFNTPEQAWDANPTIQGSTNPHDYKVVSKKTIPFNVLTYDLWGNRKDGWEINDYYPHSDVEIPETILQENDLVLLTWLKRHGPITKNARRKEWEVTDNSQDYKSGHMEIYFEYRGKPSFMLRQK